MDVSRSDFEALCTIVAELADHVRRVAVGTQSLKVNSDVDALKKRVEELRDRYGS
jgi:hypothetical protein